MAKDGEIKLNTQGVRELLQSPEMMSAIKDIASSEGEPVKDYVGFDRVHVIVEREK